MERSDIIPLSPMQVEDLAHFLANKRHGNFSDPGTRKTAVFNVQCQYLWKVEKKRVLFLMPNSLANQNRLSFFKFTDFQPEDIVLVRGTPAQRLKAMQTDAKVFIGSFNFFVADKKEGKSDYERLKELHPDVDCLGVDEFHMGFGNIESIRTQSMIYWMNDYKMKCNWFVPITGTPINGRLGSFYPIIHLIEPRYYYNHKTFLNEHAIFNQWGGICAWKNTRKVKELLSRHSVRRTFEEVHGPEALEVIPQPIIMGDAHRRFYDDYEQKELLDKGGELVAAKHEAEATLRLYQILNCPKAIGHNFELAKDEIMEVHFQTALNAEKPIVVYASSHEEQERLYAMACKVGLRTGLINGNVLVKKRDEIDTAFKARQLDCVVASPETVAVGYDWAFVDYMVFYSMDYKDSSFVQGYRRGIRGARVTALLCYILYYADTVEEDRLTIVEGKMSLASKTDETRTVFKLRERKRKGKGKLGQMQEAMESYKEKAKSKLAQGE